MKSLRTISMMAFAAAVLFASVAQAAPTASVRIGDQLWDAATVKPNQQFDVHIVLSGFDASVNAVEYKVNMPNDFAVISNSYGFSGALDFGSTTGSGNAIGFGECVPMFQVSQGSDDVIVHTIRLFSMGFVDLSPITLSAFEGGSDDPTSPRYSTCGGPALDMESEGAMIAVTTVSNEGDSWGAVKALY